MEAREQKRQRLTAKIQKRRRRQARQEQPPPSIAERYNEEGEQRLTLALSEH
jgi:hypothetical protein